MCSLDYEPCEVWDEYQRVARKPHRCSSCRRVIYVGEKYLVHFSVYEGDWSSEKMCGLCDEIRGEFSYAHEGMIPLPSSLASTLSQCIVEGDDESETRWKPLLSEILDRQKSRSCRPLLKEDG